MSVFAHPDVELDGQYRALREEAGMLVGPEHRLLACRGQEAAEYLQGQLTNDIEALAPGEGCYGALLDRKGRMQADLRILRLSAEELLLDCEAAGREALGAHLGMYRVGRQVEFESLDEGRCVLSVIGPAAPSATGAPPLPGENAHRPIELAGARPLAVAAHLGIDLVCERAELEALREALRERGVVDVCEDATEIVRVEAGRPRFGHEMSTDTIPAEAGINERAVSFTKGCYIGQETVARLHYKGRPNRHLRGLRPARQVQAQDAVRLGDRELGRVGTAVLSPAHGPIALAILRREAEPGAIVSVGEGDVEAAVVDPPFLEPAGEDGGVG